jgi:hypothetical protein
VNVLSHHNEFRGFGEVTGLQTHEVDSCRSLLAIIIVSIPWCGEYSCVFFGIFERPDASSRNIIDAQSKETWCASCVLDQATPFTGISFGNE